MLRSDGMAMIARTWDHQGAVTGGLWAAADTRQPGPPHTFLASPSPYLLEPHRWADMVAIQHLGPGPRTEIIGTVQLFSHSRKESWKSVTVVDCEQEGQG